MGYPCVCDGRKEEEYVEPVQRIAGEFRAKGKEPTPQQVTGKLRKEWMQETGERPCGGCVNAPLRCVEKIMETQKTENRENEDLVFLPLPTIGAA